MTLAAPQFPLALADALLFLRDALGDNYGAATDEATLSRALSVDAIIQRTGDNVTTVGLRPWATAARLIRWNTEYEVGGQLSPRIDRKLQQLDAQQAQMDALAGISALVQALERQADGIAPMLGGAAPTEASF